MRSLSRIVRISSSTTRIARSASSLSRFPGAVLSDEHKMVAETCRAFADAELKPNASRTDKEHLFPKEQVRKLGELGMMGITVSPDYGGAGEWI